MQLALYDRTRGYYGAGNVRTGWLGHFVTSPELDPAFGELWASAFDQIWTACGRPPVFEIVEIGGGEGGFATAVLRSAPKPFADSLTYRIVERSPQVSERQRQIIGPDPRVSWVQSIDELDNIEAGCVFCNEVLDNLPVHVIEGNGKGFVELFVGRDDDELVYVEGDPSSEEVSAYVARHGLNPPDGVRMEVGVAAEQMVRRLAANVQRGAVIAIDYGDTSGGLAEHAQGTLVSYSQRGADDDVLVGVGTKDITSHVNWTAVSEALSTSGFDVFGPVKQRDVLHALGSAAVDENLRDRHRDAVLRGDGAGALRTLSRRQALGALTDPGGLGGLDVVIGTCDCDLPFVQQA
jgi:SAM-dependent MidA family methyltransferase